MDMGDAISELETFVWNLIFHWPQPDYYAMKQPNLVDLLIFM